MKITVKNLGPFKQAEFELGDLTIICGENNTGKTYATYALFGFLSFWYKEFVFSLYEKDVQKLLKDGTVEINLQDYMKNAGQLIGKACDEYSRQLHRVFDSSDNRFSECEFVIYIDTNKDDLINLEKSVIYKNSGTRLLSLRKEKKSLIVTITLIDDEKEAKITNDLIQFLIGNRFRDILFKSLFPYPKIFSAERTGIAVFRKQLNLSRNSLLNAMSTMDSNVDLKKLLSKGYKSYSLPIKTNLEISERYDELSKRKSFIFEKHPEILKDFAVIIGGEYRITENDELFFIPKNSKTRLTMDESSSSIRSLLDLNFYLKHIANQGDILIIDEPELNLHPKNQRRIARLFARLVNIGIKVFITTHSDYIIKELNTLIMLNQEDERLTELAENEGYHKEELISADKIKVYIAEKAPILLEGAKRKSRHLTLVPADINPKLGIEAKSFDDTIDDMIRIQDEIIWGGDA